MNRLYFVMALCALVSGCSTSPVNDPEELAAVAGSYFGVLKLNSDTKMEIQLQLNQNGFYKISHQNLRNPKELISENGVFILKDNEIQLAREDNGFRYFRYSEGKVFVYNLFHEPYTSFSDSSFYLQPPQY